VDSRSLSLLIANINDGKKGMLSLISSITNETDISSSLPPKTSTLFYITGVMVISISLSCQVFYVHSRTHSNCMSGRINPQLSQW
jgi:hypothetical protein